MTDVLPPSAKKYSMVWVYADSLTKTLDSATYLEVSKELRNLGWQVTLIAIGAANQQYIQDVEVHCIPAPQIYFLKQVIFHFRLVYFLSLNWSTIDFILFHSISLPWILPLIIIRILQRKRMPIFVVDTRTVFMIPKNKQTWKDFLRGSFTRLMEILANHWADGRTAITQHLAEVIGIPENKLWGIWPSGVNLELFTPAAANRRWPDEGEPIHLIYVGVLNYERNLLSLCKAVEKANTSGMLFILSLVGDGSERFDLEKFALNTNDRIMIIPPVHHYQVPQYLSQAHIGVLPFPDEEKFRVSSPLKLFEYMAAGLPILATRILCHTEVIGNGNYVFWAERSDELGLYEALQLIWNQQAQLNEMSLSAAHVAHDWTTLASAKKLKKALEQGLSTLH